MFICNSLIHLTVNFISLVFVVSVGHVRKTMKPKYGKFFFSSDCSKIITDRGVRTIRNWPVIKIFSVWTIWIADKLLNISEEKKTQSQKDWSTPESIYGTGISKRFCWNFHCFQPRFRDFHRLEIVKQHPNNAGIWADSVSRPDIGEHKFDGTVRQKLGVGKWKKNRGFDAPKSNKNW